MGEWCDSTYTTGRTLSSPAKKAEVPSKSIKEAIAVHWREVVRSPRVPQVATEERGQNPESMRKSVLEQ